MRLKDKVAIITGGSRGIGRAISLTLAREGATVLVTYQQNADAANEVTGQIQQAGGRAVAIQADSASLDDTRQPLRRDRPHRTRNQHTYK